MAPAAQAPLAAYLEIGKRKTFAGAIDWPGWCRSGADEAAALERLLAYAPRYAAAIAAGELAFTAPADASGFEVVERLEGDSTTDFGAPAIAPSADQQPIDPDDVQRYAALLEACWGTFDRAIEAAKGKELRKGPRGGGRELPKIVDHVVGAEAAYLRRLGWKLGPNESEDAAGRAVQLRELVPQALAAGARGELPTEGPRGGKRWAPRYYVRRSAWHILDHAWEIEDRIE